MPSCWLAVGFGPAGIMEGPYAAKLLAGRIARRVLHGTGGEHHPAAARSEDEADRAILASLDPGQCPERK